MLIAIQADYRENPSGIPQLLSEIEDISLSVLCLAGDLRYTLLDKLMSIRDKHLLRKINDLIGNVDLDNIIFKVTPEQKKMLEDSENDIRKGNLMSDDALNDKEDLWLNG